MQELEQPSLRIEFLSSHSSFPSMIVMPSPQIAEHIDGTPEQIHPSSTAHSSEQPSFEFKFPSSHSVKIIKESPHFGEQFEGVPEQT